MTKILFDFFLFSYIFVIDLLQYIVIRCILCDAIQTITSLRSNEKVISNYCSLICFIKLKILGILSIFGLSFVYTFSCFFLLILILTMFFQSELSYSVLNCWAGPLTPYEIDGGSSVAAPMSKSILFREIEDQLLRE